MAKMKIVNGRGMIIESGDANIVGEALREYFFSQEDGEIGGYTTYELNKNVEELPNKLVNTNYPEDNVWIRAKAMIEDKEVIMSYLWDDDNCLVFECEDWDADLVNEDCEKDYIWGWRTKNFVQFYSEELLSENQIKSWRYK